MCCRKPGGHQALLLGAHKAHMLLLPPSSAPLAPLVLAAPLCMPRPWRWRWLLLLAGFNCSLLRDRTSSALTLFPEQRLRWGFDRAGSLIAIEPERLPAKPRSQGARVHACEPCCMHAGLSFLAIVRMAAVALQHGHAACDHMGPWQHAA